MLSKLVLTHGQDVVILDAGQVLQQGHAAGVDAIGRLMLDTDQGRVEVLSGDVSLRLAPAISSSSNGLS